MAEDDFSWEDDDDESVAPESRPLDAVTSSQRTLAPKKAADASDVHSLPSSQFHTPTTMSPRDSSEESYDVISGNASAVGDVKEGAKKNEEDEDEDESDWE